MVRFTESRLNEIFKSGSGKNILVYGDLMIDRYLWGNVSRISPEAPVPIINIEDEEIRFGGAANVANNLIGLGATPVIVGVIGNDLWGENFRSLLNKNELPDGGLLVDEGRPTTIKTRIIGNNQHIARVDREKVNRVGKNLLGTAYNFIHENIANISALVIQDYNKGMIVPESIKQMIELANTHKKIITVDPKFNNFMDFRGVTVFKPNKKETEEALAMRIQSDEDLKTACNILLKQLSAKSILITRGEEGMALIEESGEFSLVETRTRNVADVSGAGDTVIATLTFGLAAGCSIPEAVTLSNFAAGLVCGEVGVVPVKRDKLIKSILINQDYFHS